jgi:predicted dehydrogenase
MLRVIQVGLGAQGRHWLRTLPEMPELASYAALVDVSADAIAQAREILGQPDVPCFDSLEKALDAVEADAVMCVTPPEFHEATIVPALEAGLHVLAEKPIAHTTESTHRIVKAARKARGITMMAQKGRYHPWVRRFREIVKSGELGDLNHLTYWYKDSKLWWGAFRAVMDDPLMLEMSIHHFDLIRALLGRDPVSVWAETWNAPWSRFKGDVFAIARFKFEGDLPVLYYGNKVSRGNMTSWYGEITAEGENATLTVDYPRLYLTRMGSTYMFPTGPQEDVMRATDDRPNGASNHAVFQEFHAAIAEGRPAESSIEDNLKSMAMVTAAIDSSRSGTERKIADYLI